MKIERDKWYVTRNVGRVRVIATDLPGEQPIAIVYEDGVIGTRYPGGGMFCSREDRCDLVSEYVEPPKPLEGWGTAIGHDVTGIYRSEAAAKRVVDEYGGGRRVVHMREVVK